MKKLLVLLDLIIGLPCTSIKSGFGDNRLEYKKMPPYYFVSSAGFTRAELAVPVSCRPTPKMLFPPYWIRELQKAVQVYRVTAIADIRALTAKKNPYHSHIRILDPKLGAEDLRLMESKTNPEFVSFASPALEKYWVNRVLGLGE